MTPEPIIIFALAGSFCLLLPMVLALVIRRRKQRERFIERLGDETHVSRRHVA